MKRSVDREIAISTLSGEPREARIEVEGCVDGKQLYRASHPSTTRRKFCQGAAG